VHRFFAPGTGNAKHKAGESGVGDGIKQVPIKRYGRTRLKSGKPFVLACRLQDYLLLLGLKVLQQVPSDDSTLLFPLDRTSMPSA
jgi:hypothetical protein